MMPAQLGDGPDLLSGRHAAQPERIGRQGSYESRIAARIAPTLNDALAPESLREQLGRLVLAG